METPRPFTDPLSVAVAGLALLALAAASFGNSLNRQLRVPGPIDTATVVALPPTDAPPPLTLLPLPKDEPPPKAPAPPRQSARSAPRVENDLAASPAPVIEAEAPPITAPPELTAAAEEAVDAVSTGPVEPAAPQPSPVAPVEPPRLEP